VSAIKNHLMVAKQSEMETLRKLEIRQSYETPFVKYCYSTMGIVYGILGEDKRMFTQVNQRVAVDW
jgi:hypothetical protein